MSVGTELVKDPARYIEGVLSVLALGVGLYLLSLPLWNLDVGDAGPSFAAAAVSLGALLFYGFIMVVMSSWHLYALAKKRWPLARKTRRWVTLHHFILFAYFGVLRFLTFPTEIIWPAIMALALISGILHMRMRLLEQ